MHAHVSVDTCPPHEEDKPEGSLHGNGDETLHCASSALHPARLQCPTALATARLDRILLLTWSPCLDTTVPPGTWSSATRPSSREGSYDRNTASAQGPGGRVEAEAAPGSPRGHRHRGLRALPSGTASRRLGTEVAVSAQDTRDVSAAVPSRTGTPTWALRAGAGPSPQEPHIGRSTRGARRPDVL